VFFLFLIYFHVIINRYSGYWKKWVERSKVQSSSSSDYGFYWQLLDEAISIEPINPSTVKQTSIDMNQYILRTYQNLLSLGAPP